MVQNLDIDATLENAIRQDRLDRMVSERTQELIFLQIARCQIGDVIFKPNADFKEAHIVYTDALHIKGVNYEEKEAYGKTYFIRTP